MDGRTVKVDDHQARAIYQYLIRNNYVDEEDNVTKEYREDAQAKSLAPVPDSLKPIEEGVHTLVQAIYDASVLQKMFADANKPKVLENPLNGRFEKAEFQKLWNTINHKYAYTVDFNSDELISKAITHIDSELYVSQLQYAVSHAAQRDTLDADMVRSGDSFNAAQTRTKTLKHAVHGQVPYDLLGKNCGGNRLDPPHRCGDFKGNQAVYVCNVSEQPGRVHHEGHSPDQGAESHHDRRAYHL